MKAPSLSVWVMRITSLLQPQQAHQAGDVAPELRLLLEHLFTLMCTITHKWDVRRDQGRSRSRGVKMASLGLEIFELWVFIHTTKSLNHPLNHIWMVKAISQNSSSAVRIKIHGMVIDLKALPNKNLTNHSLVQAHQ